MPESTLVHLNGFRAEIVAGMFLRSNKPDMTSARPVPGQQAAS
jgi:hypothetical protein